MILASQEYMRSVSFHALAAYCARNITARLDSPPSQGISES
jgi:hypothetical protein